MHRTARDRCGCWNLIFAPGFSTAEQVTECPAAWAWTWSEKNITSLGGTVGIDSAEGFTDEGLGPPAARWPSWDGMGVGVGESATSAVPIGGRILPGQADTGIKTVAGTGPRRRA